MVIVIIGGFVRLGSGHTESFESGFERLPFLDSIGPASIGLIAFNGLWNYDGWNQLNFVAEEIQDPMKNLPRSILISMPIVVIVYVLMNVSYLSAMSAEQLVNSDAVGVVCDRLQHFPTPETELFCVSVVGRGGPWFMELDHSFVCLHISLWNSSCITLCIRQTGHT